MSNDNSLSSSYLKLRIIRGYPLKKIQENNEAEIMEVVLDEARSSYPVEIVVELQSEGTEDNGRVSSLRPRPEMRSRQRRSSIAECVESGLQEATGKLSS